MGIGAVYVGRSTVQFVAATVKELERETPNPPARRRKWLWIVLASILIVILGFGAYVVWFLTNYQPLTQGSVSGISPSARDLGSYDSPHGESFDAYRVVFREGQPFYYEFAIANNGPVGVTITHIGGLPVELFPFVPQTVQIGDQSGPAQYAIAGSHAHPFQPFVLPAGQERMVRINGVLKHCSSYDLRSRAWASTIPVTFRVFGVTRRTEIYPNFVIYYSPSPRCAHP